MAAVGNGTDRSINIAMLGASGRMGRSIIPFIAAATDGLRLSCAFTAQGDSSFGQYYGVVA